jgi:glyoxylase-like metal-dependent hydrolase (beta-lactamase superfamily II)
MRFLLSLALLASLASAQQRDFSQVQIKAEKVAGNVYMLTGLGGNIGVSVGDDGVLIVDDQFAPLAPKIQAALQSITDKPVRFVLNTHFHGDHTGGNPEFGRSALIVAHENVRRRLLTPSATSAQPAMGKEGLPVITFNDRATVHINGEDIQAFHVPQGHTDGDSLIYFTKSNVVHMGDDFFNGAFPFIDLASGGTVRGYVAAVEKAIAQFPPDAKVIPGHGPLSGIADLKKFAAVLRDCIAIVESNLKSGKTAEEMKKAKILDKYESWGKAFISTDRFIDTLARDLGKK